MMLSPEGQEKLKQILKDLEALGKPKQADQYFKSQGMVKYPEFPDCFEDNLNHCNIQN